MHQLALKVMDVFHPAWSWPSTLSSFIPAHWNALWKLKQKDLFASYCTYIKVVGKVMRLIATGSNSIRRHWYSESCLATEASGGHTVDVFGVLNQWRLFTVVAQFASYGLVDCLRYAGCCDPSVDQTLAQRGAWGAGDSWDRTPHVVLNHPQENTALPRTSNVPTFERVCSIACFSETGVL